MSRLNDFLRTDPRDVGCDEAMAVLHVYAELCTQDPARAERLHPGLAVHLAACGPCATDLKGLLELLRSPDAR